MFAELNAHLSTGADLADVVEQGARRYFKPANQETYGGHNPYREAMARFIEFHAETYRYEATI